MAKIIQFILRTVSILQIISIFLISTPNRNLQRCQLICASFWQMFFLAATLHLSSASLLPCLSHHKSTRADPYPGFRLCYLCMPHLSQFLGLIRFNNHSINIANEQKLFIVVSLMAVKLFSSSSFFCYFSLF